MKYAVVAVAGLLCYPSAALAQGVTDAQIASIVVTANQVDIDAGKIAEARATSHEVKTFARLMVTDHTGVNKSATDLPWTKKIELPGVMELIRVEDVTAKLDELLALAPEVRL